MTFAPTTDPPVASVTRPVMLPLSIWAQTGNAGVSANISAAKTVIRIRFAAFLVPAWSLRSPALPPGVPCRPSGHWDHDVNAFMVGYEYPATGPQALWGGIRPPIFSEELLGPNSNSGLSYPNAQVPRRLGLVRCPVFNANRIFLLRVRDEPGRLARLTVSRDCCPRLRPVLAPCYSPRPAETIMI